mgnify:CR=1 FL=1
MFNTLNALNSLIVSRKGFAAEDLIQQLSAFLRHSLKNQDDQWVPLKEELQALEAYLAIQQVRFGERLVLEIPEAKVFTNLKAAQSFQHAIASHGCRIALEQFGSGLNSFQLLQHLDPAFLKIDRAFIADLAKNAENQKKVREIAEAGRAAGKLTVAEFVQDAGSMTVLFGSGVDYVEGHFLAPAGPEMTYEFG